MGFVACVPELRVLVLHQRDQRELLGGISELEEYYYPSSCPRFAFVSAVAE